MLRILARLLAVAFAAVFVVCAAAGVFLRVAASRLTQPQVYKDALAKERFYDRIPAIAAEVTARVLQNGDRMRGVRNDPTEESAAGLLLQFTPADRETLFGAVLPPSYVRQQTDQALDQLFDWLHSTAAVPTVTISLGELKQKMTSPATEEAYLRILRTKPPCTTSELRADGGLPVGCCPSPEDLPQVQQGFHMVMEQAAGQIPETMDLCKVLGENSATDAATRMLTEVRTPLVELEWAAWWSLGVPAVLLVLIAALAVRSVRGWMLWWGIPSLIAGSAGVALALSAGPVANWINACCVLPNIPVDASAAQIEPLTGVVRFVVQSVMDAALRSAGVLALAGLAAVILGLVIGAPSKTAEVAKSK